MEREQMTKRRERQKEVDTKKERRKVRPKELEQTCLSGILLRDLKRHREKEKERQIEGD